MVCNVDQQILLQETLNSTFARDSWDDLEGCRGDIDVGDEDTGMEVILCEVLSEGAHLLNTNVGVRKELDPNRANVWGGRIGIVWRDRIGVSLHHSV